LQQLADLSGVRRDAIGVRQKYHSLAGIGIVSGAKSNGTRSGMALLVGQREILFMLGKIGFHNVNKLHISIGKG